MRLTILFILLFSCLNAQPLQNDIKISKDNNPSTFLCSNPKLFIKDKNEVLATWIDRRRGVERSYAQRFTKNLTPIGTNFEIHGQDYNVYIGDYCLSTKLSLYSVGWGGGSGTRHKGRIIKGNTFFSPEFEIGSNSNIHVIQNTVSTDIIKHNNSFLSIMGGSGLSALRSIDSAGNILFQYDRSMRLGDVGVKLNSLNNNTYGLFWISQCEPLYGSFFSGVDSLMVDKVAIIPLNYQPSIKIKTIRALCVNDTIHQILLVETDSLKLISIRLDKYGKLITPPLKIDIPRCFYSATQKELYNFSLTDIVNHKFDVITTIKTGTKYCNTIFSFSEQNDFLGITKVDSIIFSEKLDDNIIKISDTKYLRLFTKGLNMYIGEFENFQDFNFRIVNDNQTGSNEMNFTIIKRDEESALSIWTDELSIKGRIVSSLGGILSEPITLPTSDIYFASDHSSIGFKKAPLTQDWYCLLMYNLDPQFNIIGIDTIKKNNSPLPIYNYSYIRDANNNIILLYSNYQQLRGCIINNYGQLIKDTLITNMDNYDDLRILEKVDNILTINHGDYIKKISCDLTFFGNSYKAARNLTALKNNVYLNINIWWTPLDVGIYQGWFYSDTGAILNKYSYQIFYNDGMEFAAGPLNSAYYLITARDADFFYGRIFTSPNNQYINQVALHPGNIGLSKKIFRCCFVGKKLLYTWSDSRDGNYDIYGNIYDLSSIMEVEKNPHYLRNFSLSQNYPNPFNPSTTITFTIKEESLVNLNVYDQLGRKAGEIISNTKLPAGKYHYNFDASKLSSGVYFYTLTAGNNILTKKMTLIK